jgi:hypothetical protein
MIPSMGQGEFRDEAGASEFRFLIGSALTGLMQRSRLRPSVPALHLDHIVVQLPERTNQDQTRAAAEAIARAVFRALGGTE